MKIALAQINTTAGDFDAIYEKLLSYAQRAQAEAAQLIVFPSSTLMGADPMALIDNKAYVGEALLVLDKLAHVLEIPAIVPIKIGTAGMVVPSWAYIHDGKVSYAGMFDRFGPIEIDGFEVGLAFTSDDLDAYTSGMLDADVVCYCPVAGFEIDREQTTYAAAVAGGAFVSEVESLDGSWLCVANAVGCYEDYIFMGGSFVMAPSGELVAAAPSLEETLLICEFDVDSETPEAPVSAPVSYERERFMWDAAVLCVRDQVNKRGHEGALLVLDATLASSITAAITADALGPERVRALLCAEGGAKQDAFALAQALHLAQLEELDEVRLHDTALELGSGVDGDASDIELTLQKSLLAACLASEAQARNLLVVAPSDKTALALEETGACVSVPSFAPLGDVFRSDVIALARWRNSNSPIFSEAVLGRTWPTPQLAPLSGAPSREFAINTIDAALLFYFQRNAGFDELVSLGQGQEFVQVLLERLRATRVARRGAPAFPVMSAQSLDEAAAPLTDVWRDRGVNVPASVLKNIPHPMELSGFGADEGPSNFADILQEFAEPEGQTSASAQDMQARLNEMLSFIQEMAGAARLEKQDKKGKGDQGLTWIDNFFSEN